MKSLYIVRHAKSSWANFGQQDFDRPLNDRGLNDAPEMASRLLKNKIKIDAFISSPAKRAITTCKLFCEEYGVKEKKIIRIEKLYHAPVNVFREVVSFIDDEFKSAAIFSHNPGITEFVNTLTEIKVDNMPTCAVFGVTADVKRWEDFNESKKTFLFFDYPKKH